MEGKFQDQVQLDQELEEWLSPRGIQPDRGLFPGEDKQEYIQIEGLDLQVAIITNQASEGEISTMVIVKWSDAIKEPRVKLYVTLCGGLYKKDRGSIVP